MLLCVRACVPVMSVLGSKQIARLGQDGSAVKIPTMEADLSSVCRVHRKRVETSAL